MRHAGRRKEARPGPALPLGAPGILWAVPCGVGPLRRPSQVVELPPQVSLCPRRWSADSGGELPSLAPAPLGRAHVGTSFKV